MFNILEKNNPEKAREIFNSYFQLNKQIEVGIPKQFKVQI